MRHVDLVIRLWQHSHIDELWYYRVETLEDDFYIYARNPEQAVKYVESTMRTHVRCYEMPQHRYRTSNGNMTYMFEVNYTGALPDTSKYEENELQVCE